MIIQSMLLCLALNVYYEARGESDAGQQAVAHVTLNRARKNKSSVCSEVFKKNQFEWTENTSKVPFNKNGAWIKAQRNAEIALRSSDNTGGAYFFHSKKCKKTAIFKRAGVFTKQIGNHFFYAKR